MSLPLLNNLDKSTWQKLSFGEIAQSIGERIDPTTTDLETYVGLEHIDPQTIHIKRFGKREDVKGTKLRCYPGDIIFGRRRAYQRKAAICEFDGFCSAHSLVLRAIPEVIDPKLFPFFLHSDQFMHRAVDISVGGLSPTINWTKLKKEEFLIPPKDQQAKLAELLWVADASFERDSSLKDALHMSLRVERNQIFSGDSNNNKLSVASDPSLEMLKIREILDPDQGILNGIYKSKEFQGSGTRIINMKEMFAFPILKNQKMELIQLTNKELSQFAVNEGDLIFARRSLVVEGAGKCALIGQHETPMVCESSIIRTRFNLERVLPDYLFQFFLSASGRKSMRRIVCFTTVAGITGSDLKLMKIPVIHPGRQLEIVKLLAEFSPRIRFAEIQMRRTKQLLKSLINQIF